MCMVGSYASASLVRIRIRGMRGGVHLSALLGTVLVVLAGTEYWCATFLHDV